MTTWDGRMMKFQRSVQIALLAFLAACSTTSRATKSTPNETVGRRPTDLPRGGPVLENPTGSCPCGPSGDFQITQEFTLDVPAGARSVKVRLAAPRDDDMPQRISEFVIDSSVPTELVADNLRNRWILCEPPPGTSKLTIRTTYRLTRYEIVTGAEPHLVRPYSLDEFEYFAPYLAEDSVADLSESVRSRAADIAKSEENPVKIAEAIYLDLVNGMEIEPTSKGSSSAPTASRVLSARRGTAFGLAAAFVGLARAANLPARLKSGVVLSKAATDRSLELPTIAWAEFWAPEFGWVPVDPASGVYFRKGKASGIVGDSTIGIIGKSDAAPDPVLVDYYFSNQDNRRLTLGNLGDLAVPSHSGDVMIATPIDAMVEIDGRAIAEGSIWRSTLRATVR